jgi:hypothetical protein
MSELVVREYWKARRLSGLPPGKRRPLHFAAKVDALFGVKHRRNFVAFFLLKINSQKKQQNYEEPPFSANEAVLF